VLIEDWPISKVRPYPNNPRVMRNAAEKVAESIKAFGWRQPIVVDADGVIIAGHGRHAAAQLLKLKTVPVHIAKDLSPDQVRALRVADNKTATFSEWDDAKLADELAVIMEGLGNSAVTGFSQSELDAILMKASAEVTAITEQPSGEQPAEQEGDDFGLDESEEQPTNETPATRDDAPPAPDMVPFNALLTVDARQVVYDAMAKAKQKHGLETTGDALLVICRGYLDA
jgi:ParB-like chromosome segregation protein Spo0J